jgi:transglutaminase-like putative cysteine protease
MEKSSERWWDLPSAIFLFFAVLFSAWRLQSTNWVEGLQHVRNISLAGVVIGLALGQSLFNKRAAILLSIGYMLMVFLWQWLGYIELPKEIQLLEQFEILFGRLWTGVRELLAKRPVEDPLFFIAYLSIPYWLAGVYSGYQTTRHANALTALLPGGALMFLVYLNHYAVTDYNWLFAAFFFAALLLISRLKHLTDRRQWRRERVQLSSESSFDINNITLASAAVLIALAWMIPFTVQPNAQAKAAWQHVSDKWSPESDKEIFASINEERPPRPTEAVIQKELALGTQTLQSAFVTFLVYAPAAAQELPRLYWRGYVYDRFEEGRWQSSTPERLAFEPQDGEFEIPQWEQRKNLSFTFDVYIKGQNILYTPSQPVWVNRNAAILHAATSSDDAAMDVMILQAVPPLDVGDVYRVSALLANPTIVELKEAGQEYPAWVVENYLQLPEDFSPRIQELAHEITEEYDTPYDKTAAITAYLREEIEYAPAITFPEEYVDPLEYFLFEYKKGFCNYSASAEVLMLRSIGIPARLAVGFAQGEASLQNTLYTVRERDLHAWPEVYFPDYGWVEFEPTGNQNPLERPLEREEKPVETSNPLNVPFEAPLVPEEQDGDIPAADEQYFIGFLSRTQILQISAALAGILLAALAVLLKRRFAPTLTLESALRTAIQRSGWETPAWVDAGLNWSALSPIERAFQSINISLRWMGRPQAIHATAAERAGLLKRLIPAAALSIEVLLNEHQSNLFSPRGGNSSAARQAARIILFQTMYARLKIIILGYN